MYKKTKARSGGLILHWRYLSCCRLLLPHFRPVLLLPKQKATYDVYRDEYRAFIGIKIVQKCMDVTGSGWTAGRKKRMSLIHLGLLWLHRSRHWLCVRYCLVTTSRLAVGTKVTWVQLPKLLALNHSVDCAKQSGLHLIKVQPKLKVVTILASQVIPVTATVRPQPTSKSTPTTRKTG